MQIKHYVEWICNDGFQVFSKVEEIESRDINKLSINSNVAQFELFDRIVGEMEYKGEKYPVKTEKLNKELFRIGYFYSLEDIKDIRGIRVYDEYVANGYVGEIICVNSWRSIPVLKKELNSVLSHLLPSPHIKFKDLEDSRARRAKIENSKGYEL